MADEEAYDDITSDDQSEDRKVSLSLCGSSLQYDLDSCAIGCNKKVQDATTGTPQSTVADDPTAITNGWTVLDEKDINKFSLRSLRSMAPTAPTYDSSTKDERGFMIRKKKEIIAILVVTHVALIGIGVYIGSGKAEVEEVIEQPMIFVPSNETALSFFDNTPIDCGDGITIDPTGDEPVRRALRGTDRKVKCKGTITRSRSPTIPPNQNPTTGAAASPPSLSVGATNANHSLQNPPSQPPAMSPITSQSFKSPTEVPTTSPSKGPSNSPTNSPSEPSTKSPSEPSIVTPSARPSREPSKLPTKPSSEPPSVVPSARPSKEPFKLPTKSPSKPPTSGPSTRPSEGPSKSPTKSPSKPLTNRPTEAWPTYVPTESPTSTPSNFPSEELTTDTDTICQTAEDDCLCGVCVSECPPGFPDTTFCNKRCQYQETTNDGSTTSEPPLVLFLNHADGYTGQIEVAFGTKNSACTGIFGLSTVDDDDDGTGLYQIQKPLGVPSCYSDNEKLDVNIFIKHYPDGSAFKKIRTSCDEPLYIGQEFGTYAVAGFCNDRSNCGIYHGVSN